MPVLGVVRAVRDNGSLVDQGVDVQRSWIVRVSMVLALTTMAAVGASGVGAAEQARLLAKEDLPPIVDRHPPVRSGIGYWSGYQARSLSAQRLSEAVESLDGSVARHFHKIVEDGLAYVRLKSWDGHLWPVDYTMVAGVAAILARNPAGARAMLKDLERPPLVLTPGSVPTAPERRVPIRVGTLGEEAWAFRMIVPRKLPPLGNSYVSYGEAAVFAWRRANLVVIATVSCGAQPIAPPCNGYQRPLLIPTARAYAAAIDARAKARTG
jgi:hypothetical protein